MAERRAAVALSCTVLFAWLLLIALRVTGTVAQALQVRMLEAESERSQSRPVNDAQAQDLALRAWSLLRRRSREDIASARELLQQAVAREPSSAFAWALLAESYAADVGGRTPSVVRTERDHSISDWANTPVIVCPTLSSRVVDKRCLSCV